MEETRACREQPRRLIHNLMIGGKSYWVFLIFWMAMVPWIHAGETAVKLTKATDIVEVWGEGQHLYVKGNIGLGDRQLANLEQWLDENATNWTILLVQNARNEEYRDQGGRNHQSLDAVEHAVGQGLAAKTGFGELIHPETGEANGASFVLFLEERKFSYYGSDAYDRRGLGGKNFTGKLDRSAINAMRNGGRIVDAVKNTVKDIDARLAKRINQETERAEQQRLNEERHAESVRKQISEGEQELLVVESLLAEFRKEEQYAEGDIAETDSAKWQADLKSAHDALAAGQIKMAETVALVARHEMKTLTDIIRDFREDGAVIEALEKDLALQKAHPANKEGEELLKKLPQILADTKGAHEGGNLTYRDSLKSLRAGIARVQAGNLEVAEKLRFQEQKKKHQEEMRKRTITGVGTGAGTLLLAGGVMGNRRRRKLKAEAEALLTQRQEELKEVSDKLIALMDRTGVVVGPEADLPRRGYEGETLLEARRALAAVDEAFVISSHVQELIEKGEALIQPGNPLTAAKNLVSRGSYLNAIELLDDEVTIRPASPPPLPDTGEGNLPERLGVAEGEDFILELPEWQVRLKDAMEEGSDALDLVDEAWATIVRRREALSRAIFRLKEREEEVATHAEDGWFGLERMFGEWIPRMEELHEEGMAQGQNDPVAALGGPIKEGDRMVAEAGELLENIARFRKDRWNELKRNEEKLTQQGQATVWLDQQLDSLTETAEQLAGKGAGASVAEGVRAFGNSLRALVARLENAVRQAIRADESCLSALEAAEREVSRAREELAKQLQLSSDKVLAESPERNPSRLLDEGRKQRDAAESALDVGDPERAQEFLDEVDRLVDEAGSLVSETEDAYENYERYRHEVTTNRDHWGRRVRTTKELIATLRNSYAADALLVDVGVGAGVSYADAPQRFDEGLRVTAELLEKAATGYAAARILESQEQLEAGEERVAAGEELCSEVEERRDELAALEKKNTEALKERIRVCEDLEGQLSDRRVMRETLDLFAEALANLAESRGAVESAPNQNNPYRAAELLSNLNDRLEVVRSEVANDIRVYQHAVEVLEKVRLSEKEAQGLVSRAHADGIPDSKRTKEGVVAVQSASRSLAGASEALKEDHGDWRVLTDELGRVHAELSEASIELREELRLARQAIETIKQAEAIVRTASRWRGRYGVHIVGTPGGDAIVDANRAIMAGEYHPCMRHAGFAIAQARQAIAQAEAKEASIRRARAAAVAARQAAARRSRMSRSSGGFGGSFGGGGNSFGRSSSVGRSSFSSSSGMGRSGW